MFTDIMCPAQKVITVKEAVERLNKDLENFKESGDLKLNLAALCVLIHAINKANLIDIDNDL